ncbi:hypothetical protein L0244_22375, partial [bacterium]|nr:hypothetical protein [bacterium]
DPDAGLKYFNPFHETCLIQAMDLIHGVSRNPDTAPEQILDFYNKVGPLWLINHYVKTVSWQKKLCFNFEDPLAHPFPESVHGKERLSYQRFMSFFTPPGKKIIPFVFSFRGGGPDMKLISFYSEPVRFIVFELKKLERIFDFWRLRDQLIESTERPSDELSKVPSLGSTIATQDDITAMVQTDALAQLMNYSVHPVSVGLSLDPPQRTRYKVKSPLDAYLLTFYLERVSKNVGWCLDCGHAFVSMNKKKKYCNFQCNSNYNSKRSQKRQRATIRLFKTGSSLLEIERKTGSDAGTIKGWISKYLTEQGKKTKEIKSIINNLQDR